MGKKKGKKHAHDRHDAPQFALPPQVAGVAAAAIKQVNTPAFQQLIADSLGAASKAMAAMAANSTRGTASHVPPVPPTPPVPPVPPVPPEPPKASEHAYRPQFDGPHVTIPPQAAEAIERVAEQAAHAIENAAGHASRAIETAAAALERWVEKQAERKAP